MAASKPPQVIFATTPGLNAAIDLAVAVENRVLEPGAPRFPKTALLREAVTAHVREVLSTHRVEAMEAARNLAPRPAPEVVADMADVLAELDLPDVADAVRGDIATPPPAARRR